MLKRRSIRAKMAALVIIPLVALLGLWLLATALTVGPARNLADSALLAKTVGGPAQRVVAELQTERRLTVVLLAAPGGTTTELGAQRNATDTAIADFRRLAADPEVAARADEVVKKRISDFAIALNQLPGYRTAADEAYTLKSADGRAAAMTRYTGIIDMAYRLFTPLAQVEDPELAQLSRTLIALSRARELVAQEDALVSAVGRAGVLTLTDVTDIAGAVGAQRQMFADASGDLPDDDRARYSAMIRGDAFVQLAVMENGLLAKATPGKAAPINQTNWRTAADTVMKALRSFEEQAGAAPAQRSEAAVSAAYTRIAAAGAAGLLAVGLALWVGLRVSRSVAGRLLRLRDTATDLAEAELPAVVAKLRRGERVEVAESDLLFGVDEIGEVSAAFAQVRRTAVQAAVDEAVLRHGLNEVFLNVARRSQTLLHRQLRLLDRMERRAKEPQELEDLFRLDHLSTRMRRHAEDLVILAGGAPSRGWRHPVAAVDVVRGAVSEIEEYVRVAVDKVPDLAIAGRAVGDIIHLLAELIENGTSFSPPQTRVQVTAQWVGSPAERGEAPRSDRAGGSAIGLAISIEDRGLGMTVDALAEANAKLATPPDFDPADSARLGLLVVGRLAARHGITVTLGRSAFGGVAAVVLVPAVLISAIPVKANAPQPGDAPAALPARPASPAAGSAAVGSAAVGSAAVGAAAVGAAAVGPAAVGSAAAETAPGVSPVPGAPAAPATPSAPAAPSVSARPSVPDAADAASPVSAVDVGGLPRRNRNAEPPSTVEPVAEASTPSGGRTPQRVRANLAAFQKGIASGRASVATDPPAVVEERAAIGDNGPSAGADGTARPARATGTAPVPRPPVEQPGGATPGTGPAAAANEDEGDRP
ncbi:sensor histidine kinase [Hamadaea tsunoensis]|uniref:sensor histidine kinase n=1 Tax=Hamadaea tsunoensis TaxID=53368 RepID=UPI00042202F6|nr:nitrate- and nitrite sensing domain-containing protein [Hamadaea tsunoensis]